MKLAPKINKFFSIKKRANFIPKKELEKGILLSFLILSQIKEASASYEEKKKKRERR